MLSFFVKHSFAISQLLTTKDFRTPNLMLKIGPYFSTMLPRTLCAGWGPLRRWRWPMIGHAPPACGASLFLFLVIKKLNSEIKETKRRMVGMKNVEDNGIARSERNESIFLVLG